LESRIPELFAGRETLVEGEYRVLHEEGYWVDVWERCCLIRDGRGEVIRLVGCTVDISNIKRLGEARESAEAALRESQARARKKLAEIEAIYQTAPIGLSVLDTDLRFERINRRLAEINGLSAEAHLGRTVRELLPALADAIEPLLHSILETGEPLLNLEIHGETPARPGEERVWLEHFLPLKNGDRVVGINIVCEEITERIRAEKALRQSEERFRDMADNAPVMVWLTDPTGYCTYLSKSWYEFTGQTEAEGLGFGWLDATHPDDLEKSRAMFLAANEGRTAFQLEYRLRRHDGVYRWAIDAAKPWFGSGGEFKGYIGSVIDISDRKEAEFALRESEERFRQLAENLSEIVFWIDTPALDRSLYVSPAYERVWGRARESLYENPRAWLDAIHPDDRDRVRAAIIEQAPTGDYDEEYRIFRPDGTERWIRDRGFPIADDTGRPYRLVGIAEDITARVEGERERQLTATRLKQVNERLALALRSAPLSLFTQDRDLRYTWIYNPTQNYSIDEVIGRRDEELVSPETAVPLTRLKRQVLETGIGTRSEVTVNAGGNVGYYDLTIEPIVNERNEITGITCAAVDISERVRAETVSRQNEARLKQLVELNLLGVMFWDVDGTVLDANDAFLDVVGYSREDLLAGRVNWRSMTPPEHLPKSEDSLNKMRRNSSDTIEKEYIRADGTRVPVLLGGVMFQDSSDLGVSFVVDITDRARTERRLQESEARLKLAYEATRSGLWDWDIESDRTHVSKEYLALFGFDPAARDIDFGQWLNRIHPDDRDREATKIRETIERRREDYRAEYRVLHPDGVRWLASRGQVFYDDSGEALRMIGIVQDISDRARAELQLQRQATELRTLNAALERTTDRLSERNRELDRFVYTVSHDLKAPLRAISNLAQWLADDLEGQLEGESLRFLQLLQGRVGRMVSLIDGLLLYSRVGRAEVATETVNTNELIEEILDSLAPPPAFTIVVESEIPSFATKRLLLSQVLSNLLGNAIKHHDRPNGRIEIRAFRRDDVYEFSVADDGPGIAPEDRERVFEIFQTLKSRDEQENTGLGLSIVKKIVETEGGSIVLEPRTERGVTFRFTWPLGSPPIAASEGK
jgi:PAS domain S-box-containing protein